MDATFTLYSRKPTRFHRKSDFLRVLGLTIGKVKRKRIMIFKVVIVAFWGEFRGIAPTGKKITWEAVSIWRIVDGKIVERESL